jgi:c-di-GMP-binding flagellar brake protein YcgR
MNRVEGKGMGESEGSVREKSQRRFARIKASLKALIKVEIDDGRELFHAETKNISRGGVCLHIEDKTQEVLRFADAMSQGLMISLSLKDADSKTESYAVKTAWINSKLGWMVTPSGGDAPVMMGVAFNELSEADAGKIDTFTRNLLQRQKEAIFRNRIDAILHTKRNRET